MTSSKPKSEEGIIISGKTGKPVSFFDMVEDLKTVRIIYIGEKHTDKAHHNIQLQMIRTLFNASHRVSVGMEMFDHSYQDILNQWSAGMTDTEIFLKQTHWYANWKFDFDLYKDILLFIKENRIPLIGLNIPFHIPPKIAVGGFENLSEDDKKHMPKTIDVSDKGHRAYLEDIFKQHHVKGRDSFEDFYVTQCAWEHGMAETLYHHIGDAGVMIILIGNGHIVRKFGVPDRAFKINGAPFRTIYLAPFGKPYDLSFGDYIWMTPEIP